MSRIIYVNGKYSYHNKSYTHVEDRGFQFSDGVYEVIAVWNSKPVDFVAHIDRLYRSMNELLFKSQPYSQLINIASKEIIRLNKIKYGTIYIQVNRGIGRRNHLFSNNLKHSLVVIGNNHLNFKKTNASSGISLISTYDQRWARRDIKSISLLPNVLSKQYAHRKKKFESLLIDDDNSITEASTANVWIVDKNNTLITRPADTRILSGVTRNRIIKIAKKYNYKVTEKKFFLEDIYEANEVFLTGTTVAIKSVTKVNNKYISSGVPGEITNILRKKYFNFLNSL